MCGQVQDFWAREAGICSLRSQDAITEGIVLGRKPVCVLINVACVEPWIVIGLYLAHADEVRRCSWAFWHLLSIIFILRSSCQASLKYSTQILTSMKWTVPEINFSQIPGEWFKRLPTQDTIEWPGSKYITCQMSNISLSSDVKRANRIYCGRSFRSWSLFAKSSLQSCALKKKKLLQWWWGRARRWWWRGGRRRRWGRRWWRGRCGRGGSRGRRGRRGGRGKHWQ